MMRRLWRFDGDPDVQVFVGLEATLTDVPSDFRLREDHGGKSDRTWWELLDDDTARRLPAMATYLGLIAEPIRN
jgi:hypothetical protein